MNFKTLLKAGVLCGSLAMHGLVWAQEPQAPASSQQVITDAKGKKITVVDFDDANIEGKAKAPDGFLLQSRQSGNYKTVIELRRNFRTQINGTAYEGLMGNPVAP
jgi:hypothetical protein